MPSVIAIETLEAAEVHIRAYQEATPITPAASPSRFSTMLASLRAALTCRWSSGGQASTPFVSGLDRLIWKQPYDFIISSLG